MSFKVSQELNERGALEVIWAEPVKGIYIDAPDTQNPPGFLPFMVGMHIEGGRPISNEIETALWDTSMTAIGAVRSHGYGMLVETDGTKSFVSNDAGRWYRWDAAGNAWISIFNAQDGFNHDDGPWNATNIADYLVFCSPVFGNWKWDGQNFLPLGAKIISDMEADQDAQWSGETVTSVVDDFVEGLQGYRTGSIVSSGTATLTFTPTVNLDLTTPLNLALDYSVANAKIGFFLKVSDASEFDEAASNLEIATLTGVNELQIPATAWEDKETGLPMVLTDGVWLHIEIDLNDAAWVETGTFLLSDVDSIKFFFENDGAGATEAFIDCLYIIYQAQMPGVVTMAVWDNVLLGGGFGILNVDDYIYAGPVDTYVPSHLFYTPSGAPDEWSVLAAIDVNSSDGGGITALHRFYNQVFIGKEATCHSLGGSITGTVYPEFNYEVLDVTTEHGADGHRSIAESQSKLYFSWKYQMYEYNGTGTKEIGEPIQTEIEQFFDNATDWFNQYRSAIYWPPRGELYLVGDDVQNAGQQFRIRWSPITGEFVEAVDANQAGDIVQLQRIPNLTTNDLVLVGNDFNGNFFSIDGDINSIGTAVSQTRLARFPWTDAGRPREWKNWGDVWIGFDLITGGTITVQYRVADKPALMVATPFITIATLDADAFAEGGRIQIGDSGRFFQIQFVATGTGTGDMRLQFPLIIEAVPAGRWV